MKRYKVKEKSIAWYFIKALPIICIILFIIVCGVVGCNELAGM